MRAEGGRAHLDVASRARGEQGEGRAKRACRRRRASGARRHLRSGAGADVELARLPVEPAHHELERSVGADGDALTLSGGEVFQLLFAAPMDAAEADLATRVGVATDGDRARALDPDGGEHRATSTGHRHRLG